MSPTNEMTAIEVANLTICYKRFVAVDRVSFTIRKGEIFGFLGHNGAGKTSIIKVLATLKRDCWGSVNIYGVNVLKQPSRVRGMISLVSQNNSLDVFLNVYDNLYFYAWLQKVPRRERREKVTALLDFFGLLEKRNQFVTSLSGGEYRRLQLAKIFLGDARIYFLDEPSVGLDYRAKEIFWKYLQRTCKETGYTIVLATNDLVEAEQMCDRIAFLNKGRIVGLGTPAELEGMLNKVIIDVQFVDVQAQAVEAITQRGVVNGRVENVRGNTVQLRYLGNGSPFTLFVRDLEQFGKIQSLTMRQANLHDVFLELMKPQTKETP